jgi:hypothetical protein
MLEVMHNPRLPLALRVYAADAASPYISERERSEKESEIKKKLNMIPRHPNVPRLCPRSWFVYHDTELQ